MASSRLLALALCLAGCTTLDAPHQGPLEPQAVQGTCRIKTFFLLPLTMVHTTMTLAHDGSTCGFTVINPDVQVFPTAAVVSRPPTAGRAVADLVNGGRSVQIAYTPTPGAPTPDRFTVTIEPNDITIAVAVAP